MWAVRQGLPRPLGTQPAPAGAQWREALQMQRMWQDLRPKSQPLQAPGSARRVAAHTASGWQEGGGTWLHAPEASVWVHQARSPRGCGDEQGEQLFGAPAQQQHQQQLLQRWL